MLPSQPFEFPILTADDGSFSYTDVPEGDYTLRVFWAGGFVSGGAAEAPDLWRAVFRINKDGTIGVPPELPATWPGSFGGEPFEPVRDHVVIGPVPGVILLKPKPLGVFPYPVDDGSTGPLGVGTLDLGAALAGRLPGAAGLPRAGDGATGAASGLAAWTATGGVGLLVLVAVTFARPWRRRRRL